MKPGSYSVSEDGSLVRIGDAPGGTGDRNGESRPNAARVGTSIAAGFIPIVSEIHAWSELITGKDYITGTRTNRWLAALGVVLGAVDLEGITELGKLRKLSSAAETGAAQPLALGLKDAGLEQFAQARGATLATGENWQATVLEKLADPNTTVHFNLDEVDVWQGVQRAASGRGGPTDWELLQIQQNPQYWDTLQFWKGGQPAPNPFK
jgi:hypothetical protein